MTPITTRNTIISDISEIHQDKRLGIIDTINRSLNEPGWGEDTSLIGRKYLYNPENHQVFQIAKLADQIIGYVIVREDTQDVNTSYLSYVAVHQNHQGKGVGGALLKSAVDKVKKCGMTTLVLDCETKNCPFYEKFAEKNKFPNSKERIGLFRSGEVKMRMTINLV